MIGFGNFTKIKEILLSRFWTIALVASTSGSMIEILGSTSSGVKDNQHVLTAISNQLMTFMPSGVE